MSENKVKIAGLIYGDGYITKKGNICFHHSIKQRNYVEYKLTILEKLGFKLLDSRINTKISGFSTNYGYVGSSTSTNLGKKLRKEFYRDNKKCIPIDLIRNFSWDEWALIYQDDGRLNKISHINKKVNGEKIRIETPPFVNRYEICLGHPSDEELKALQYSLKNLGISSWILTKKDGQRNLAISKKDSKIKFFKNIKHRIHNSMSYKIDVIPTLDLLR